MRRLLLSGLMVLAFSVTAFAGVDVSKLQLPGDITQAQADTVIKGALAKAKEQGVPMNIAVVDAGGNLKAFTRMDGAFLGSIDISIGKARTARLFNMPTSALGAASQPGKELYGIEVTNNGLVIFGGGELLKNKDGVRNTQRDNPSLMISLDGRPRELTGRVIGGTLASAGNYRIALDNDNTHTTHLIAGINEEQSQ